MTKPCLMETEIPSSDLDPKLCSNNKCRKVMEVPWPGWRCEKNRFEVTLSSLFNFDCSVALRRGKFCERFHGKSSGWRCCTACKKRIHYGCIVSESSYVRSTPRGIKCIECTKQPEILMANLISPAATGTLLRATSEGNSGNSTSNTQESGPSPPSGERVFEAETSVVGSSKISVPSTMVAKDQGTTDQENESENGDERPTPPPLLFENTKGTKTSTWREHRYVPRLTEQELKQMSRGSNVEVTPLFEKVLTVSDTGKIGRLVIPKKCAELHFPSIDIPEGKPLAFQDSEGKDWEFHFRYWPNNNSRMYVLEGFIHYVTSMKLQAGDTVMFSRLEPEGKLVMGHRKDTIDSSSSQAGLFRKNMVTGSSTIDVSKEKKTPKASILAKRKHSEMDMVESPTNGNLNNNTTSAMSSMDKNPNDPINVHSDVLGAKSFTPAKKKKCGTSMQTASTSKRGLRAMTVLALPSTLSQKKPNMMGSKDCIRRKRKHSEMVLTSKSSDHENKMADLDLTFKAGQELIRSRPGGNPPSVMVFEGVKLKSYKDDPIIGRPSMFTEYDQDSVQWAQCEKCFKWRKVLIDVEIPVGWTCRENHWDLLRSRCSAREELTVDMIKYIFSVNNQGSSKKIRPRNLETEPVGAVTPVENVAALPDKPKANKKHPRHRPGCACIVCIQAPSGSKHKSSCECSSCKTARRRRLLKTRRGIKRSKIGRPKSQNTKSSTSISNQKTEKTLTDQPENVPMLPDAGTSNLNDQLVVNGGSEVNQNTKSSSSSPAKPSFDLNLLPEPEEDDIDAVVTSLI
ncbi:hypothetical protein LXL04_034250 [Taraxacum kok-saghyz]